MRMPKKRIAILGLITAILLGVAATVDQDKYFEIIKNIEIFTNVYKEVNASYVDGTDPSKLMKTGIDAMLASLDPFTNYFSEAQVEDYRLSTEGKYNGIGAKGKKMGNYVVITEVYKDYPAFKAGLRVGDQILAVNGLDAKDKQAEDLYQIMRGIPKSEVTVTVLRPGSKEKQNIKLVRDEVNIPNVPYSGMVDSEIGYVILTTFTENAGRNVQSAVNKLKNENPGLKGIIFDLRENGGGLLGEAVQVCNTFVPGGNLIVSTRGKEKEYNASYKTMTPAVDENIPLVVLINKNSASASEIVSGTMQDLDRAILIGQLSYGKGLVQNTKETGYNSRVKFTTAKYYIPSGRCIQSVKYENGIRVHLPDSLRSAFKTKNGRTVYDGGGVQPDIEMKETEYPEIVQKLMDGNWIFNYVTGYCLAHTEEHDPKTYKFTDFDDFVNYLKKNAFEDSSALEKKLNLFAEELGRQKRQDFNQDIERLKNKLDQDQWEGIRAHKELITHVLEEEIVSRTGYESGRLLNRLQYDPLIKKAAEVLKSPAEYNRILAKKG